MVVMADKTRGLNIDLGIPSGDLLGFPPWFRAACPDAINSIMSDLMPYKEEVGMVGMVGIPVHQVHQAPVGPTEPNFELEKKKDRL